MANIKATSLRLEESMANELALIARAEEVPISEVIRAAISRYIADRRGDPKLQDRFKQILQEDTTLIERLTGD